MRWMQPKANPKCAGQPLAQLVRNELDDDACRQLALHLDDCEACQQRLTALAGESQWWLEAGRWLDPAAGGMDSGHEGPLSDCFADDDPRFSNPEQQLLASGLLAPSDKSGVIGTLGRYEVHGVIGSGGTGIVLKAIDLELNRTVAIKVLAPALAASGAARRRFAREGQAVAAVAHENVVAVHHVDADKCLPFLVMQYIDGDSLQDLVVRNGPLDVKTALRMTAQVASALAAAHDQGLVHRDVKPANILVGATGQRVWITDFGLARAVDDASLTRTGFIAGTPHYMSPEQARGEAVRTSSDLFGLGSVLYFMLTGRPPFRAERTLAILNRICNEPHRPVREVNSEVPAAIADLVDRLLSKSASDRVPDADAVREHCLHLLAALATPDGDLDKIELGDGPCAPVDATVELVADRKRFRYGPLVVVSMLLIGAVAGYLSRSGPADDEPTEGTRGNVAVENEAEEAPIADKPVAFAASTGGADEPGRFAGEADARTEGVMAAPGIDAAPEPIRAKQTLPGKRQRSSPPTWSPTQDSASNGVWRAAGEDSPVGRVSSLPLATDSQAGSLRHGTDPTTTRPAGGIATQYAQPAAPRTQFHEPPATNEEFSVWAMNLNELQKSLHIFETQIEDSQPATRANRHLAIPPAPDSFGDQLRWVEGGLRTLESKPVSVN